MRKNKGTEHFQEKCAAVFRPDRRKNAFVALSLALFALAVFGANLAHAQSSLGIGTAEPAFQTTGPFGSFFAWINTQQQGFYRTLTGALKGMRENPWQLWSLIGLSFAYGVFHAAGPGHGKAVISSYMIANETELKRGVVLSFLSSFMQGIVAILLVGAAYLLLRGTAISMTQATHGLEVMSYALIATFGGWLLFRKVRAIYARQPIATPAQAQLAHAGHHHHHDHAGHEHGHHHAHHDHSHADGTVCSTCGHAHAPDPSMLKGERFQLREAWSAVIAVGLRPCSGALIVLTFALLNGLYLGGILSVFAMSIGTAITVSLLATLAVTAKDLAVRYAGNGSSAMRITNGIEISGALMVLVLGLMLLGASLQS